jgi:hypothetical protein
MNNDRLAKQKWQQQLASLWPAIKASLARVRKPCIREGCRACARGDKHPAWLLSLSHRGRRTTMYVPGALVPAVKRAIQNGKKIEALLYRAGPELIRRNRKNTQNR